nr:bacillithiol system redox-active protein YtxJ [Salisediminibacterium selenitireducens]
MSVDKITTWDELDAKKATGRPLFIFKNSTTCPVSREAFSEVKGFVQGYDGEAPVVYLNVQEARELSNRIAEEYGVKHESPQLLLIDDTEVKWHASHWKITEKAISRALSDQT